MKDFKTFINEQKSLSARQSASNDKVDGVAGLGHGINAHKVLNHPSHHYGGPQVILRNTQTAYNFEKLFNSGQYASLLGDIMMPEGDRAKLTDVIENMPNTHAKQQLMKDMEKVIAMPVSDYKNSKLKSIIKQIYGNSMGPGSSQYIDYNDKSSVYTPARTASWSN